MWVIMLLSLIRYEKHTFIWTSYFYSSFYYGTIYLYLLPSIWVQILDIGTAVNAA